MSSVWTKLLGESLSSNSINKSHSLSFPYKVLGGSEAHILKVHFVMHSPRPRTNLFIMNLIQLELPRMATCQSNWITAWDFVIIPTPQAELLWICLPPSYHWQPFPTMKLMPRRRRRRVPQELCLQRLECQQWRPETRRKGREAGSPLLLVDNLSLLIGRSLQ